MKITIEVDSKTELEKLLALFKSLEINEIEVMAANPIDKSIVRGAKTINPTDLFGIWKDAPRNITDLRNPSQPKDHQN